MILVTGGAGFIGAALTLGLLDHGKRVRVFDDFSRGRARRLAGPKATAWRKEGALETVEGDIRDGSAVITAARGCSTILHLAAINGTRFFYERPAEVLEVGIRGMLNVLDACRNAETETLLVASSSEVYHTPAHIPTDESAPFIIPDPRNPRYSYAGSKIASELLALHRRPGPPGRAIIMRPHNVYGPDMGEEHVIPQLIRRIATAFADAPSPDAPIDLPLQGDGSQMRAFMHIDDFVRAALLVLDRGNDGSIYHLGNPEEYTIAKLVDLIAARLNLAVHIRPGPAPEGETTRRCPDITLLAGLGFMPKITLDQGLTSAIEWYRKPMQGEEHTP